MTKLTPFFSVVIPALNEEKHLPLLLEDLAVQTYVDFEVIVADGYSKDRTPNIVKDWASKDLRFHLTSSKDRGAGLQRNLGAKQAIGNIIIFLDADTRIPKFFLEGVHYHLQLNPCDLFTNWAEPDGKNSRDKAFVRVMNAALEGGIKLGQPVAIASCIGFKHEVFEKIGGFDSSITYMEDVEIVRRSVKQGFSFNVYKDPVYTMSLRRLRKDGTLHLYRTMPNMVKQLLINQKNTSPVDSYPMLGGNYFNSKGKKKSKKRSLAQFKEFLALVKKMNRSRKQIVQKMMQDLLP